MTGSGRHPASRPLPRRRLAALVAVLVLVVGTVGTWGALENQHRSETDRAARAVGAATEALARQVERDVAGVVGLALDLGDRLPELTAAEYERMLDRLRLSGAFVSGSAANLAQAVPAGEVDRFLGSLPPSVRDGMDVRLSDRSVHLIITHVWPVWANQDARGFDVLASPGAIMAASRAFAEGQVSATGPIELVQDPGGQLAFIAYVPVRGQEHDVAGLITTIFRGQELFDAAVALPPGVELRLVDVDAGLELARSPGFDDALTVRAHDVSDLLGRHWRLEAVTTSDVLSAPERALPWLILGIALAVAALVVAAVAKARRDERRAWTLVEERTAELAAAAHELELANARLREADQIKDDLLASVSHDLRSPLTVISGFARLLRNPEISPDDLEAGLERIDQQSARLTRLVEDLLTASQLQQQGITTEPGPIDVCETVHLVMDGLGIGRLVDSDEEVVAWADPHHLERIVTNLLTNASRHGAPPFEVRVRGVGEEVEITVRDHGPGIAEEHRDAVFAAFTQVGEGHRGGVGLGLTIARQLAQANGGDLRYEDAPGGGARFLLTVPRQLASNVEDEASVTSR